MPQNGQCYSAVIITLLAITPKVFMYSPVVSPTTAIIFTVSISHRAYPLKVSKVEYDLPAKLYLRRQSSEEQTSENWEARPTARNEATLLRRKAIRTYWEEQATKLKCKPSEFYNTFMPFLTDKHKINTNELSLSIN